MCHAGYAPHLPHDDLPRMQAGPPPLPYGLRLSPRERADLVAAVDRIWAEAIRAASRGERTGTFSLRRELDEQGHRFWAVRQDRDPCMIYAALPRAFMAFWPGSRPVALLEFVSRLVASARRAAGDPDAPGSVIRLSR